MCLVVNKCIIVVILCNISRHYLRKHSAPDTGIFGYIDVIYPKKRSASLSVADSSRDIRII
jgi:hypothetical protein